MRAVEQRWLSDKERAERRRKEAALETHRLRYVYFLNRLEETFRLSDAECVELDAEIREIARACRAERAAYLEVSEAEADAQHGTVIEAARRLAKLEGGL